MKKILVVALAVGIFVTGMIQTASADMFYHYEGDNSVTHVSVYFGIYGVDDWSEFEDQGTYMSYFQATYTTDSDDSEEGFNAEDSYRGEGTCILLPIAGFIFDFPHSVLPGTSSSSFEIDNMAGVYSWSVSPYNFSSNATLTKLDAPPSDATVPAPGAILLFCTGIVGLAGSKFKKRGMAA